MRVRLFVTSCAMLAVTSSPAELLPRTTLGNSAMRFTVPEKHYVVLRRGPIEAVTVDNHAVDDAVLPGHRAGYHGIGSLKHEKQPRNIFVPAYSGLNFEHIHDGTVQPSDVLYEPRRAPMELRAIDERTAELYQAPTPHWGLESCLRYQLLGDEVIEMTFECIPRGATYRNGYIGLFWASYIHQPESLDIHFLARTNGTGTSSWVRGITPKHGIDATHRSWIDHRDFAHDKDFPLTLVFNFSRHRYAEPWYIGECRGMAFVPMFRARDQVWLTQSPSGGGNGNPAWDFQWFIQNPKVNQRYQLIMRVLYTPSPSRDFERLRSRMARARPDE